MLRILGITLLSATLAGCSSNAKPTAADGGPKAGGPKADDPKADSSRKTRPTETVTVNAVDLAKEYEADKKAAEKKYADKLIDVTGVVLSANSDNGGDIPQVVLQGVPQKVSMVQC